MISGNVHLLRLRKSQLRKDFTMSNTEYLRVFDHSGKEYLFEVYPGETEEFNSVAGVYMFTKESVNQQRNGTHHILYIGKTQSFKTRLRGVHHKRGYARGMGMTHICVLRVLQTSDRKTIESRLIASYNPPLNERSG